nr:MAG TPA: hypothetical protein [Caudoviricetes sp.]
MIRSIAYYSSTPYGIHGATLIFHIKLLLSISTSLSFI